MGGGPQDAGRVEAGGVFAVAVVAATVEDGGEDAGPGDKVEDVIVSDGEVSVVQRPQ